MRTQIWPQGRQRDKKFRRDGVAPHFFAPVSRQWLGARVGKGGRPKPKMRQLVREREHLSGLGIGAVDENERGEAVGQRQPAKLIRIEGAMSVGQDDTAHHDEYAHILSLLDEQSKGFLPATTPGSRRDVELEAGGHLRSHNLRFLIQGRAADKVRLRHSASERELAIPILPLLTGVNHIEKVGTWSLHATSVVGAEVGDSVKALPAAPAGRGNPRGYALRAQTPPVDAASVAPFPLPIQAVSESGAPDHQLHSRQRARAPSVKCRH